MDDIQNSHVSYSLSEGINDLIAQDALDISVAQREGFEEHGVQHGRTGEEAVKKRECGVTLKGFAAGLRTDPLCLVNSWWLSFPAIHACGYTEVSDSASPQ